MFPDGSRRGWAGGRARDVDALVGSRMAGGGFCVFVEDVSPRLNGVLGASDPLFCPRRPGCAMAEMARGEPENSPPGI